MKHSVPTNIVLIGASTGGPGQIQQIITSLSLIENTSIILAQHMANKFMPSFTKRLQEQTKNPLSIIQNNIPLEAGHIYICTGHTKVYKQNSELIFSAIDSPANSYNPSIDLMFNSFVPFSKELNILSIILTGIGDDGVDGCKQLSINGARAITEDSSSAIVDGMPSRARENVKDIEVLSLKNIITQIKGFCK